MGPDSAAAAAAKSATTDDGGDNLAGILFPKPGDSKKPATTDDDGADGDDDDDPEHDDDAPDKPDADDPDNEDLAADDDDDDAGDDADLDPDAEDDDEPEAVADDAAALDKADQAARAKFTPEQQKQFDKAINKKVAVLKAERTAREVAEARVRELEEAADAAAGAASRPVPTAEDPLANVQTVAELESSITNAKDWRRWLRAHPEGGTLGEGDKAQEITAEQARSLAVFYDDLLTEHAPARREALKQRETADAEVVKTHPWLNTKAHPGAVEVEAQLRKNPQLRSVPGIRGILADAYVTRATRAAKAKAAAAAAASNGGKAGGDKARKPAINPAGGGDARPPKATTRKPVTKAVERLGQTGEDEGNAVLRATLFPGGND